MDKMMKGSRRKQMKPIRAFNPDTGERLPLGPGEELLSNGLEDPFLLSNGKEDEMNQDDDEDGTTIGEEEDEEQDMDIPMDMHVSVARCTKCPETFSSVDQLEEHVRLTHKIDLGIPESLRQDQVQEREPEPEVPSPPRNNMSAFPTMYHRRGSELGLSQTSIFNGLPKTSEKPAQPAAPTEPPTPDVPAEEDAAKPLNGETAKSESSRIFHRDAYCEICEKEFCNKYFLKTHKANKHGIFDNSTSFGMNSLPRSGSSQGLPGGIPTLTPLPTMVPPQETTLPPSPLRSPPSLPLPAPLPPPPPINRQEPPSSVSSASTVTSKIESIINSTFKAETASKEFKSDSSGQSKKNISDVPTSSSSSLPPNHTDMDDYCDICQKHFCNKYYLKKHKTDVHGIIPENGMSSAKKPRLSSVMDLTSSCSALGPSHMLLPPPLTSMAAMQQMHNMPPSVIMSVLNPFMASMPPAVLIPAGSLLPQQQMHHPHHSMVSQPMAMSPHPEAHNSTPSPSSQCHMGGLGLPTDPMRGMSVLNAEAYCELCRKEFCNKYFLKVHRANKHGIYEDGLPPPLGKPGGGGENAQDSSPFGHMFSPDMYKTPELFKSPEIKHEPSSSRASTPLSSTADNMTFCIPCNRDFHTKYAYKVHRMNEHGSQGDGPLESPGIPEGMDLPPLNRTSDYRGDYRSDFRNDFRNDYTNDALRQVMSMAAGGSGPGMPHGMFSSNMAVKLAERVTCDICNKDLCNKYFLKQHKAKVHGIDAPLQGSQQSQQPQQSQQSHQQQQPEQGEKKTAEPPRTSPSQGPTKPDTPFRPHADLPSMGHREIRAHQIITDSIMPGPIPSMGDFKDLKRKEPGRPPMMMEKKGNGYMPTPILSSIEPTPREELVKMGIDPEAYCDICKKEFCSKYFLRTHKQNIHGITPENTPEKERTPKNMSKNKENFEKHTWRWKEPANSSRVICEICNKELCNKYFLRTHKQNKHGIIMPPSLQNSPAVSDSDTASNSSNPTDQQFSQSQCSLPTPLAPRYSAPQNFCMSDNYLNRLGSDKHYGSENGHDQPLNLKMESRMMMGGSMPMPGPLNIPTFSPYSDFAYHRRYYSKPSKPSRDPVKREYGPIPGMDGLSSKSEDRWERSLPGKEPASEEQKTCQVCRESFPSEIAMQLHLIQEHNAKVTLKTDEPQGIEDTESEPVPPFYSFGLGFKKRVYKCRKQKLYTCLTCSYKTPWLSNMNAHEKKCRRSRRDTFKEQLQLQHSEEGEDFPNDGPRDLSTSDRTQRFKCCICKQRFASKAQCFQHIRYIHIRCFKNLPNRRQGKRACKRCGYSSRYSCLMRSHAILCKSSTSDGHYGDVSSTYPSSLYSMGLNRGDRPSSRDSPQDAASRDDIPEAASLSNGGDASSVVQSFKLHTSAPDSVFMPSVVHMPVRQRLEGSVSVTFLLTPYISK